MFDHLAANGAGLTGSQIAVVALLQVHADLPWCSFSILSAVFIYLLHNNFANTML